MQYFLEKWLFDEESNFGNKNPNSKMIQSCQETTKSKLHGIPETEGPLTLEHSG